MGIPPLVLSDYQYELPDERIARFPLTPRDASKLLVYRQGTLTHHTFRDLDALLPAQTLLVFNDTKVIPARLFFHRTTGAQIEVFLLHPQEPSPVMSEAMQQTDTCTWQAMVGNRKRWKAGEVLEKTWETPQGTITLRAEQAGADRVTFHWTPATLTFAEVLTASGEMPLPPYLKRSVTEQDRTQYQTVYSKQEGAVAAPTAGLHFTPEVLARLQTRGIALDFLTLHVSAGTFQPIKTELVTEHAMHREQVELSRQNLLHLQQHLGHIVAVGTTSMRTLESLYWFGVKLLHDPQSTFSIDQQLAYSIPATQQPSAAEALRAVEAYLDRTRQEILRGETGIYIHPGYDFKLCRGLITNYHQPGSTLILLVAAFVGADWRRIYDEALQHDYRFLSFGDSSLLLPNG